MSSEKAFLAKWPRLLDRRQTVHRKAVALA